MVGNRPDPRGVAGPGAQPDPDERDVPVPDRSGETISPPATQPVTTRSDCSDHLRRHGELGAPHFHRKRKA
jgi:hypothetical protein